MNDRLNHRLSVVPDKLFGAKSVVVIGASADPAKLSSLPLVNLQRMGYPGRIYAINPKETSINGVPCFSDVASLPEVPDLAFLVIPGALALKAAADCAAAGVAVAVVASTGFAEAGPAGQERQRALAALTQTYGMRIVGPNTNGIYSTHDRLSLGYNGGHAEKFAPGSVSIVSHSGALFHTIAESLRQAGVGIAKFVAVGNEADLNLLDYFEILIDDPRTSTILLVVEAIGDGARLRRLSARAHAAGKRVAALKLGTTKDGAASTVAHSSRLAGNARAYAALFKACGIGSVSGIEGLVAFARVDQAASRLPRPWKLAGRGLAVVTASGAGGTLIVDAGVRHGFNLAELRPETLERVREHWPEAKTANPTDIADFGLTRLRAVGVLLAADPGVDATLVFVHKLQTKASRMNYANAIAYSQFVSGKPHLVIAPAPLPRDQHALFEAGNIAVFPDTAAAMEGLRAYIDSVKVDGAAPTPHLVPVLDGRSSVLEDLNEFDSMEELDVAGLTTVSRARVKDAPAVVEFADRHGWPVVLKGVVDGVAHKSDVGLVHLNLQTPTQAAAAFRTLTDTLDSVASGDSAGARDDAGIVVQTMVKNGFELIAGVTTEFPLGRFLLVGLGGRQAEYLDDVHLWAMPVDEQDIRSGLESTSIGRVLRGARWSRKESFDEVVDALMKLQAYATNQGADLRAIEINPLSIGEWPPTALDALIVRARPEPTSTT